MAGEEHTFEIARSFKEIDSEGTGFISQADLQRYLVSANIKLGEKEITALIKEVDYFGNGKINYSEFLSATLDQGKFFTEEKLKAVFNFFDTDHSGSITEQNIKFAFQKLGQQLPADVIKQLL